MKLKKWKLIFRLIFNKKFTNMFTDVILYALNNYSEKRGSGSSDVLFYDIEYKKDIFTNNSNK